MRFSCKTKLIVLNNFTNKNTISISFSQIKKIYKMKQGVYNIDISVSGYNSTKTAKLWMQVTEKACLDRQKREDTWLKKFKQKAAKS